MRVLLCTVPDRTHFFGMVPLAWALRTAGHQVRVASQPFFVDTIAQAGLTAVGVGRGHDGLRRLTEIDPDVNEADRGGMPAPYDAAVMAPQDVRWDAISTGYRDMVDTWHKPKNFPLIAGMVEFARHWQPDLVIWEPLTYAGPIAAKACGAAHGRLLWSIDAFGVARDHFLRLQAEQPPQRRADPLADWLGGYGRKYGFDFTEDMATGQFTIDQLPDSLRMTAEGLHYLPTQYIPYGGAAVVPTWLHAPAERPRVALTLGTSATEEFAGYTVSVQDILAALSDLDIEVVATVAESEQHKLTRVPNNARLVSYVPLHALVPTCSVVINHAGPGSFLTTARHAVPQLTVPWDFDAPELARRAAEQGGSLMLRGDEVTGSAVRARVQRLLHEPKFRRGAERLRDDVFALPTPNQLVDQLDELTVKYRATPA